MIAKCKCGWGICGSCGGEVVTKTKAEERLIKAAIEHHNSWGYGDRGLTWDKVESAINAIMKERKKKL